VATLKVPVNASDHVLGDADAPVTLVEYGDYQCPHCAAAHPVVARVRQHSGKQLLFVYRHFPLTEIHPMAMGAAETAEFAGAHGRFWQMHDGLFENQDRLGLPLYVALAEALGLSVAGLQAALASGEHVRKIQADFMGGVRSGVNGTPAFFINGQRHDGPYDFPYLVQAIETRLALDGG
jgi:protein-disulfide isomerase